MDPIGTTTKADKDDLDLLESIERRATPGPWRAGPFGLQESGSRKSVRLGWSEAANTDLVVAARNSLPRLIQELRQTRSFRDEVLKRAVERCAQDTPSMAFKDGRIMVPIEDYNLIASEAYVASSAAIRLARDVVALRRRIAELEAGVR